MQGNDPLYLQMRAYLLELIERNRQVPFYRLPSENQLAMKFGASRISAKHALDMLRDEGLICRQQGRGSYIAPIPAEDAAQAPNREAMALIVPFTRTIFMSDLMDGLREALNEQSLDLVTFVTDNDQEQEMTYLRQAQERFKGILLFPCTLARYHEEVLRLVLNRFPLVQIDRYLPGLNLSCVSCDHKMATYRAVKFLREKGHRRIGFVGHMKDHASSVALRLKGFDLATQETDPGYPQSERCRHAGWLCRCIRSLYAGHAAHGDHFFQPSACAGNYCRAPAAGHGSPGAADALRQRVSNRPGFFGLSAVYYRSAAPSHRPRRSRAGKPAGLSGRPA